MKGLELRYNYEQDRVGVWDSRAGDWYIEGLHCGMCFDLQVSGSWLPVRIEYGADWYLVGFEGPDFYGQPVRFRGSV